MPDDNDTQVQPTDLIPQTMVTRQIGRYSVTMTQLSYAECRMSDIFSDVKAAQIAEKLKLMQFDSASLRQSNRALFSIRKIDDRPYAVPTSPADLDQIAIRFNESEGGLLNMEYADAFFDEKVDERAKNLVARRQSATP